MKLDRNFWLPKAKALLVGQTTRVHHGRERRPNLVIGNEAGHYWAYCQACRVAAREDKEHVRLMAVEPPQSRLPTLPDDRVLITTDGLLTDRIGAFLASKNMDFKYLQGDLYFSASRQRLLVPTPQGWLGRDLTGCSPQKWLTYSEHKYAALEAINTEVVLVEDVFSMFKLQWMLCKHARSHTAVAMLGTTIRDELMVKLVQLRPHVHLMFDGDTAGHTGASKALTSLRALGIRTTTHRIPDGKDPKDLNILDLLSYF